MRGCSVAEQQRDLGVGPARKTTLVESVMEQIIDLVRNGQLRPGERLPSEHDLMAMMDVSRSTVREALKGLAVMGLIETRAGRRSLVKALPASLFRSSSGSVTSVLERDVRSQMLSVRVFLDPEFSVWALREATEEDVNALNRAFDAFAHDLRNRHRAKSHISHNQFHRVLAEATHNVAVVWIVNALVSAIPPALSERYHDSWQEQLAAHQAIVDAVAARDEIRLRTAVLAHLDLERNAITMLLT
jgi:GntR family transcriptional regulator, transcriptional repressor for pyruvate dehydrogenase complex